MLPIRDLCATGFCILLYFVFYGEKMQHFFTDTLFTLRDWWICVIDKLCCANVLPLYGRLIARWRHGRCRCRALIRNESEILNVGMSKPLKVGSRPAVGLRGAVSTPARCPGAKNMWVKWRKTYYLKLKDMLITRCAPPYERFKVHTNCWWTIFR